MINFSTQCRMLGDIYLKNNEKNKDIKLKFLSKIISFTFFTNMDNFPTHTPVNIFCGDINSDKKTLTECLAKVIQDLNYQTCEITEDYFSCANMLTVTIA